MDRRGFTLLEMLVATGVFIIGFVAAYGLFLSGMRYRSMAENATRGALATSSLLHELRLESGATGQPEPPDQYVGDGDPHQAEGSNGVIADTDALFPYPGMPGTWYRVLSCADLQGRTGADAAFATTLHLRLLVVPFPSAAATLTLRELQRRMRFDGVDPHQPADFVDELVRRGVATRQDLVLVRRPSWMP